MDGSNVPTVTLYSRTGCHLCQQAKLLLLGCAGRFKFALREVDIDTDAFLLQQYDSAVPVIVAGEIELARAPIDAGSLGHALSRLRAQRSAGSG